MSALLRHFVAVSMIVLLPVYSGYAEQDTPPGKELTAADHALKQFEQIVARKKGAPFPLGYTERNALERVAALHKAYPEQEAVKALFERAASALRASKGETQSITDDMLAYRKTGDKLRATFWKLAEKDWEQAAEALAKEPNAMVKAWPRPNPEEVDYEAYLGRPLLLKGLLYPQNQVYDAGVEFLFVGKPSTGYYYVNMSSQAWRSIHEAVRRYRREIGGELPHDLEWETIGAIKGLDLLIPEAGNEPRTPPFIGWLVEPRMICIPGYTTITYDPKDERGASYAGEDNVQKLKETFYSIKEAPKDATPEQLVTTYITAIKEKNYPLFTTCLGPYWTDTAQTRAITNYHWDEHQSRWQTRYAHAVVRDTSIRVLSGPPASDSAQGKLEDIFLSEEDRKEQSKFDGPSVLEAVVQLQLFDERGRQVSTPKPIRLHREGEGPWTFDNPGQPN